jgi:hypothetical protein
MEGTLSYSARHKRSAEDRRAARHSHEDRRNAWSSRRRGRAETDPAEAPADQDAHAQPNLGAPAEE